MRNFRWWLVFSKSVLLIMALAGGIPPAGAVVSPDRSRVILSTDPAEESLLLTNADTIPSLIQVWVDDGNLLASPDNLNLPIAILPPVFKLAAGQQRDVRIKLLRKNFVENVEKLYWINIYQVPPNTNRKAGTMQQIVMPLRIRIKLIVRPVAMKALEESEGEIINASLVKGENAALLLSNPGKRVLSLSGIKFSNVNYNGVTLLPGETKRVSLTNKDIAGGRQTIYWSIVNDMGINWEYKREI
ncbi:fimbrial biogenesis chaperone [Pseudocitrobacter cyperus]|uniref:Fimbria/pilus periplasmic chaperone n=1 Tax=Pseudocitrobacter cyperus TaxID=3112843 RepID=A0ABV0HHF1_9ENTR